MDVVSDTDIVGVIVVDILFVKGLVVGIAVLDVV